MESMTGAAAGEKQQLTTEQARVKAQSNPTRARMLMHWFEHGVKAPVEVAQELGLELTDASYHSRVLVDIGFLELVDTEPKRGSTKHYYRATGRHLVDEDEWRKLEPLAREFHVAGSMQPLLRDFVSAASNGVFTDPAGDFIVARTPVRNLDEEGYRELMAAHRRLNEEAYEIEHLSSQRMKDSGEAPIMATSGQALWRMDSF